VIWGKTSNYTGSNTDIQKEKRMSEWQRAMKLSPQQREMVQSRMIANPYDRESTTRLERINARVNADPAVNSRTSQAFREALAMREYEQPQSYSASGESDNGYARAQRRAAQSGGQFDPMNDVSVGEVNGRRVVAPQAGRYNAYSAALAQLGLGDSPSPEAYSFAVDQARQRASIDPNKKYESDAKVRAAQIKADEDKRKRHDANVAKAEQMKAKTDGEYRKKFTVDQVAAEGKLGDIKGQAQSGYQQMQKAYADALKSRTMTMLPDQFEEMLKAANVQYAPGSDGFPVIVPRNKFELAKWNPDYQQQNADTINALTRTPGGSRAVSDYINQQYAPQIQEWKAAAEARNALPSTPQDTQTQGLGTSPQVAQDQQEATAMVNHFVQKGMTPDQAKQELLRRASRDPRLLARVQSALQAQGDRILATQVGR